MELDGQRPTQPRASRARSQHAAARLYRGGKVPLPAPPPCL